MKQCTLRQAYWLCLAGALAVLALGFATTPAIAQSQAPSTPPCSDGLPKVTPDYQPSLPLCPDPSEGDSSSADPAPIPSLPSSAPLIDRARVATLQFSQKLPNFICQEFMSRFTRQGRGEKMLRDIVSADIIYEDGKETYRNVKINNRPTDKHLQDIDGAWSTGEFVELSDTLVSADVLGKLRQCPRAVDSTCFFVNRRPNCGIIAHERFVALAFWDHLVTPLLRLQA